MNSSFPNRWSFSYLKFKKYVTNIIAEPKYKYGQQEQVTERNHNRSKKTKFDKQSLVQKIPFWHDTSSNAQYIYIVCGKYQKASVKALVQVLCVCTKHKQTGKKWLNSQS